MAICNPIIDWSDEDVWNFIRHEGLPYCELYDKGYKRLGCIGCPMASRENRERDFKDYPGYKRQYIRTFERMLAVNREKGYRKGYGSSTPFLDGQDVFDWWMRRPCFKERHQRELGDSPLFDEWED